MIVPPDDHEHISKLARKCARVVRDDTLAIIEDLEQVGWVEYLEQLERQGWIHWRAIKWEMQEATIRWRFHMPWETWRHNGRPTHDMIEFNQEMQRHGYNVSPEKLLIAREMYTERQAALMPRVMRNGNALKTHCPKGHELAGSNLVIEHRKCRGESRTCRTCKQERERKCYRNRRAA